jgi:hypothetical protein
MENLWKVEQSMKELRNQLAVEVCDGDDSLEAIKRMTCQWLADLEHQDLDANAAYRTAVVLGHHSLSDELERVGSWSIGLEKNFGKPLEELHLTGEFAQMYREFDTETAHSPGGKPIASGSSTSTSDPAHRALHPHDTNYRADTDRTKSSRFTPPSSSRRA